MKMHIPTFILWFFLVGTPLIFLAKAILGKRSTDENGNIRRPLFMVVLVIAITAAAYRGLNSAPIDTDCRPSGPGIYNDC